MILVMSSSLAGFTLLNGHVKDEADDIDLGNCKTGNRLL
jgi:hypothetical protein